MSTRSHESDAPPKSILFGIGAQKAATSWLDAQISRHPDAYFPRPKELHYWDAIRAPFHSGYVLRAATRLGAGHADGRLTHLRAHVDRKLRRKLEMVQRYRAIFSGNRWDHDAYRDYLGLSRPGKILVGDITPSYALLGRNTFKEMYLLHESVKFVFIMRDPVRRLWSGVMERNRGRLRKGLLTASQLEREFAEAVSNPRHPDRWRSDYQWTVQELEASVPTSCIFYTNYETLIDLREGAATRQALARFTGLNGLELDVSQRVRATTAEMDLPAELCRQAKVVLRPVYDFVRERFGDEYIQSWEAAHEVTV